MLGARSKRTFSMILKQTRLLFMCVSGRKMKKKKEEEEDDDEKEEEEDNLSGITL